MSSKHSRRPSSAGVTSLELALVLVPFLLIVMATFDIARYLFTVQAMVSLMTDSARYVMVQNAGGSYGTGFSSAQQTIAAFIGTTGAPQGVTPSPLLDPTQGQISINFLNQNSLPPLGVSQIQVIVTYPFTANTPGLSLLSGTLTETATYSY